MSSEEPDTEPVALADVDVEPSDYEPLAEADVRLRVNDHGLYIADDRETTVSSQGQSPEAAIENLAAAVDSYLEATTDETGDDWL